MRSPSSALKSQGPERTVVLLGIGNFAASASLRATDPLLAKLSEEFSVTPGRAAAATTAFFLAYGIFQLAHGPTGDRFGKVRVIAICGALAACATLFCALAPSLQALSAARFASGTFVGAVIPLSMAWIGDVVPYERRQVVLGRFMLGQVCGTTFGLAAGGWFAEHLDWRWSFVSIAAAFATLAVLLLVDLRSNPVHRVAAKAAPGARRHILALLAIPWVRIVLASVFLEAGFAFGAMAFIPLHLHKVHGYSVSLSGIVVTLFAAGGLAYALTAHRLVKRFGERGLIRWGGAGLVASFLALALSPWGAFAVASLPLAGLCLYAFHGTLQVHATQMAPEARGAGVSAFAFALFAGQSLGSWVGSLVVDTLGTTPIFVAASLGVAGIMTFFRAALVRRGGGSRQGE